MFLFCFVCGAGLTLPFSQAQYYRKNHRYILAVLQIYHSTSAVSICEEFRFSWMVSNWSNPALELADWCISRLAKLAAGVAEHVYPVVIFLPGPSGGITTRYTCSATFIADHTINSINFNSIFFDSIKLIPLHISMQHRTFP